MLKRDLYTVLIKPIITEKSNISAEKYQQVVFRVLPQATKIDIKIAFELAFNAKVKQVRVLNVYAKSKRFANKIGKRRSWKKAYISLEPGQTFDIASHQ